MTAQSLFIQRISSLERSLKIDAVTSKLPIEKDHNDVARLLRNGLAVVGFNSLEDFLKSRTSEVMAEVGRTPVTFSELPEKLRYAATFEAIESLSYQMSLMDNKSDKIIYIQNHALKLASTNNTTYELTPHAFAYAQANVNTDTIRNILKSFQINDPWNQMTLLASRLGLVALPLEETFKSASIRRHRAAHAANADTPQSDIIQYVKEAYAIAISFDCLLTKALFKLQTYDSDYINNKRIVSASDIKFREVKKVGNLWKEYIEGHNRASRTNINLNIVMSGAITRAHAANQALIQYDETGRIVSWDCM